MLSPNCRKENSYNFDLTVLMNGTWIEAPVAIEAIDELQFTACLSIVYYV